MTVAQELLKDNQDNLEKKSGSLCKDELDSLNLVKNKTDVVDNAQKTMLKINTKEGAPISVSAKVLIEAIARGVSLAEGTNYKQKLQSADIRLRVGNKNYSVDTKELGRWSEVMAFLQVAAGGNLVPDGKFGQATADAFSKFIVINTGTQTKVEEKDKLPEKEIDKQTMDGYIRKALIYNITVNKLGKPIADLFKARGIVWDDNKFVPTRVFAGEKSLQISKYTSPYRKWDQSMSIEYRTITAQDWSVDDLKLITQIKQNIDKTDAQGKKEKAKEIADKNAKTLENSANNALDNLNVSAINNPLVKGFITAKWYSTNGELDFKSGVGSGMSLASGLIKVDVPTSPLSFTLNTYKKADNTFDGTKFINDLTNKMLPLAKNWWRSTLTSEYNTLVKKPAISNITDQKDIAARRNEYTELQKKVTEYTKNGVLLDPKIQQIIPKNIDQLNKQKNYLVAKDFLSSDITSLENQNQKEMSRDKLIKLNNTINERVERLSSGSLLTPAPSSVNAKNAFTNVNKLNEYNTYLNRYKALLG